MAARACSGATESSKSIAQTEKNREVLLEPPPEPQNARKAPLEPAPEREKARKVALEPTPEPQYAREVPLEPTAVRCVRFLRSKTAGFCSFAIGINFCSAPLCSVGLGSNWPLQPARASLGRSTGQNHTKANRTRQVELTRRRLAGQDHGCLLHSTQRRTFSVHGMHGYALVYIYIYLLEQDLRGAQG